MTAPAQRSTQHRQLRKPMVRWPWHAPHALNNGYISCQGRPEARFSLQVRGRKPRRVRPLPPPLQPNPSGERQPACAACGWHCAARACRRASRAAAARAPNPTRRAHPIRRFAPGADPPCVRQCSWRCWPLPVPPPRAGTSLRRVRAADSCSCLDSCCSPSITKLSLPPLPDCCWLTRRSATRQLGCR